MIFNCVVSLFSSQSQNTFTYPSNIYESINSDTCADVHFIEYYNDQWFKDKKGDSILNKRVLSTSVKNSSEMNPGKGASYYRIYTGERRVTPKGAECLKWQKNKWDNTVCSVKVNHQLLISE